MAELRLSNSDLICIIDDNLLEAFSKYKWQINHNGYVEGSRHSSFYKQFKTRRIHRIIYQLINNKTIPQNIEIDHVDRNPLNNVSSNLREATRSQNARNTRPREGGTCEYKGVRWCSRARVYIAEITIDNKKIFLGRFECSKQAALRWNEESLKYYGCFAYQNEIDKEGINESNIC